MYIRIFLLILVIMLLSLILNKIFDKENFTNSEDKIVGNKNINSIILSISDNFYFGTFIESDENKDIDLSKYNFKTTSLQSNKWQRNDNIDIFNNHIVVIDLSYDSEKRLMAVGLHFNEDKKPEYHVYNKSSSDLKSRWLRHTYKPNIQILCLCYDINNSKLLAVNKTDGQIYEQKNSWDWDNWVGPINFDKPVKKIMYDKTEHLIGIGKDDGFIYKKKDADWRDKNNKWEYVNKTEVYDLIYDIDGCLIATTPFGIKKQRFPDFFSTFDDITKKRKNDHEQILDKIDILKYKIGFEFLDELFQDSDIKVVKEYFERIYGYKKRLQNLCLTRNKNKKYKLDKDISVSNAETNKDIQELYSKINSTIDKFK